jgi:hypothetical protein
MPSCRVAWTRFLESDPRIRLYLHSSATPPSESEALVSETIPGTIIVDTVPTRWGSFTLIDAQRQLLARALTDKSSHMIMVSGDTCPVRSAADLMAQLELCGESSMFCTYAGGSIERETGCRRDAWPFDTWTWVKHSQWVVLSRADARTIVDHHEAMRDVFVESHAPDEHSYGMLLLAHDRPPVQRNIMHVNWQRRTEDEAVSCKRQCNDRGIPRVYHREDLPDLQLGFEKYGRPFFARKFCSCCSEHFFC